jgi:hypothetical protein
MKAVPACGIPVHCILLPTFNYRAPLMIDINFILLRDLKNEHHVLRKYSPGNLEQILWGPKEIHDFRQKQFYDLHFLMHVR